MTMSKQRMRWACILWLFICLPGAGFAEEIEWHADRPLTWSDFKGPVDHNAPSRNVAQTAASLGWSYEIETSISDGSCTYRVSELRISAVFHPEESWVRPGHKNSAVLAHEQGHFDITEIHRRMFREEVGALLRSPRPCEGRTTRKVSNFIERELARLVKEPYEKIWREHLRVQDAYDSQTGHGTDAAAQRAWLELIADGIAGKRWQELSGLRASR